MLQRYADRRGFRTELLSANESDGGGVKEMVFAVKGDGAYSVFKWEGGTHRVQRVPETESQGRIHTSTATVAVMPEVEEVEVTIEEKDLKIDVYRSTGPGGQSVNTTDSAVRITHMPDRDRRRDAGREVTAPEQEQGDARAPGAAVRGRARAPAGRDRRDAEGAGRHRRARREDPDLQLRRRTASPTIGSSSRSTAWIRSSQATSRSSPKRSPPRSVDGPSKPESSSVDDDRRGHSTLDRASPREGLREPAARRRAAAREGARAGADRAVHVPRPAARRRRSSTPRGRSSPGAQRASRCSTSSVSGASGGSRSGSTRGRSSPAPRPRCSSSVRSRCFATSIGATRARCRDRNRGDRARGRRRASRARSSPGSTSRADALDARAGERRAHRARDRPRASTTSGAGFPDGPWDAVLANPPYVDPASPTPRCSPRCGTSSRRSRSSRPMRTRRSSRRRSRCCRPEVCIVLEVGDEQAAIASPSFVRARGSSTSR